jgi:hypothetical protein
MRFESGSSESVLTAPYSASAHLFFPHKGIKMRLVSIDTNRWHNLYFWANLPIGRGIITFINRCRNNGVESNESVSNARLGFRGT